MSKSLLLNPALRGFIALAEHGSLALAGQAMYRTPSAVSLQVTSLEERLGRQLFVRGSRGMTLTPAGRVLLEHVRSLQRLERAALEEMSAAGLGGTVRFGMPQDFASSKLASTLSEFRKCHPAVTVAAAVERCSRISEMVSRQELDLAVLISRRTLPNSLASVQKSTNWHAAADFRFDRSEPLPLVVVDPPCIFRDDALRALERAGVRYSIAFASSSITGMWAAVQAGVGVTARTSFGAPQDVVDISSALCDVALPPVTLSLVATATNVSETVDMLAKLVAEELEH